MEPNKNESNSKQLLFNIQEVSQILGGMKASTIRRLVKDGKLRRCDHLASRPWYFTQNQLQEFINGASRNHDEHR